eukprot:jgi/Botrbrau1/3053/Bobra.0070s0048.1
MGGGGDAFLPLFLRPFFFVRFVSASICLQHPSRPPARALNLKLRATDSACKDGENQWGHPKGFPVRNRLRPASGGGPVPRVIIGMGLCYRSAATDGWLDGEMTDGWLDTLHARTVMESVE